MDIRCPKCGEPWDHDELHEQASLDGRSYDDVAAEFRARGCAAFDGARCTVPADSEMAEAAQTLYDLLGDDMDGAASMLEDFAL